MENEKSHKRQPLSSDPRISRYDRVKNWEEGVESESFAEMYYETMREELEELGVTIPKDAKMLEIGSGSGVLLQYLQKIGLDAVGVDARPRGEKT